MPFIPFSEDEISKEPKTFTPFKFVPFTQDEIEAYKAQSAQPVQSAQAPDRPSGLTSTSTKKTAVSTGGPGTSTSAGLSKTDTLQTASPIYALGTDAQKAKLSVQPQSASGESQAGLSPTSVANSPDFSEKSAYQGKGEDYNIWKKVDAADRLYRYLNNDYDRSGWGPLDSLNDKVESAIAQLMAGGVSVDEMSPEEVGIYNYYMNAGDTKGARDYIESLRQTLDTRKAERIAKETLDKEGLDKAVAVAGTAISGGLAAAPTGLSQFLETATGSDRIIDKTWMEQAQNLTRQELDGGYGVLSDVLYSAGNMGNSAALGAVNPLAGAMLMGAQSTGSTYADAIAEGYSPEEARLYAGINGALEGGLQYALGGISSLGKGGASRLLSRVPALQTLGKTVQSAIKSPAVQSGLQTSGRFIAQMGDEAFEEYMQAIIDPVVRNVVLNENNEINPLSEDALYSALVGAVSGGLMNLPGTVADVASNRVNIRSAAQTNTPDGGSVTAENVQESASAAPPDTTVQTSVSPQSANTAGNTAGASASPRPAAYQVADMSAQAKKRRSDAVRETGAAYQVDPAILDTVAKAAENTGRNIQFVETLGAGRDGQYDASTGTLYLAADSASPIRAVLKHELTHSLEGTQAYAELSDYMLSEVIGPDAQAHGMTAEDFIQEKISRYSEAGETLTWDGAIRELVADYTATKLFTDEASIRGLSAKRPSLARRILNWIRSMKTKLFGTKEEKMLARAEQLYHDALMAPFRKGGGVRYSIQTNPDGSRYVRIDTDQDIFEGVPRAQWPSVARRYIKEHFQGKTLPLGEYDAARVKAKASGEYAYPSNPLSTSSAEFAAKMRASTELDNLMEAAEYSYSSKDTKNHPEATNGWDYYTVRFVLDGRAFEGLINIANGESRRQFYDMTKIREVPAISVEPDTSLVRSSPAFRNLSSNSTVPQSTDGVNTSISENPPNDAQYSLDYLGEDIGTEMANSILRRRQAAENPVEIGRLTPQDADTTPPVTGSQRDTGTGYTVPTEPATQGDSESHFTENVGRSSIFDDRFKKLSLEDAGIHTYDSITNKDTLNAANKKLNDGGYRAVTDWFSKPVSRATPEDIATGIILLSRYQLAGDYEGMVNAARRLRKMGTSAGQTVQEFSILGRMTPEGMAYYAQKSLDEAFEAMVKNRSQSWVNKNADKFRLTDEDIRFIMDKTAQASKLPEGRDKSILLGEIAARVQNKIPPEKGQNIRALARISMLLNPKTNVRNILGNVSITPVSWLDDLIGTAVDKAVARKTGKRTTGLFNPKSFKGLGTGVYESFDDFRRGINTRDIDADRFEIGRGAKSFNEHHTGAASVLNPMSKALNALDRTTSFLLEAGDRGFFEMWFMNSLNNQMKLNGVKTPTAEMVEVARQDALSRTWQDTNGYTKFVSGVKKALNAVNVGGYGLGDVFIKFTKTPANLTKALVDYSPVGLTKAIAADGRRFYQAATRGEATPQLQRRFVNSLSKGITGTLLMILFAALADRGILQGKGDADSDVAEFEKNILGIQPYSVKIGDKSYSYEWMQPIGGSAAIVADIVSQMKGEKPKQYFKGGTQAEEAANSILSAIQSGGQVLYDQSFMQSLANLFESDGLVQGLLDGILAEPSVFVPQIVSQTSQLLDDTARRSYVSGRPLETAENKILARTPWRTQLEPVVDTLGREVAGNNNVWDAYFNPATTYTANPTPAAEEMYRVYQETGDKRVIPPKAPNSISVSVDGEQQTVSLTAQQKTAYQKTTGSIASREVNHLLQSSQYRQLSETDKADVLADIYAYANAVAKSEVSEYTLTGSNAKIARAEDAGISVADYLILSLSKDADGNGTVSQKEMRQALDATDFTTEQKSVLWQLQNAGWKTNPYGSAYQETDIDRLLRGALS